MQSMLRKRTPAYAATIRPLIGALLIAALAVTLLLGGSVSAATSDPDFSIGYYASDATKSNLIMFTYENPGPGTITGLQGEFDFKVPWVRFDIGDGTNRYRTGGSTTAFAMP